jgi:hypothetical protein
MLNGMCDPEDDNANVLANKVKYSIIWECEGTLRDVLVDTGVNKYKPDKVEVLKECLIDAIARNNVPAVKVLFEDLCVSLDQFDVSLRLRKSKDVLEMDHNEPNLGKYIENGGWWFQLLTGMKHSQGSGGAHVDVLKMEAKTQTPSLSGESRLEKTKSKKDKMLSVMLADQPTDEQLAALANEDKCSANDLFFIAKHERRLLLLEGIYHNLLGENFCYHIGCMGPEMDLFFLNVLYNRIEMADFFWQRSPRPVVSAISAAYLLRQMAKRDGVEPAAQILMIENANLFEEKAVGVMKMAQKTDRQFATQALDCPNRLWMDMPLLDLAVESDCGRFVEECCVEAIDARMYGDIDPYQNSFWWIAFNVFPLLGLWAAIGSRFPFLEGWFPSVKFKIPPVDDVVRASTQRRLMPRGFPSRPNENPILSRPPYEYQAPWCDAAYPTKCWRGVYAQCTVSVCLVHDSRTWARTCEGLHAFARMRGRRVVCACLFCAK